MALLSPPSSSRFLAATVAATRGGGSNNGNRGISISLQFILVIFIGIFTISNLRLLITHTVPSSSSLSVLSLNETLSTRNNKDFILSSSSSSSSSSGIPSLPNNAIQNQVAHTRNDVDDNDNHNRHHHRNNNAGEPKDEHEEILDDFVKQPNVVIAVKIHDVTYVKQLKQSLCLFSAAYNHKLHYDILIFVTIPLPDTDIQVLRDIVRPAQLWIENDKFATVQQHLQAMTTKQQEILLERCGIKKNNETNATSESSSTLQWWTRCCEDDNTRSRSAPCMPLRYNWQAEFRSKHMWQSNSSILNKYKYMMWLDSDAFAIRVWQHDPIAFVIRNKLKMSFANFPQGKTKGMEIVDKVYKAYGGGEEESKICTVRLVHGHLEAVLQGSDSCQQGEEPYVPHIHGFFYIVDLDFYRSPENLNWYDIMIGTAKFSRKWDDQLAVTIPAAMRAPNASWSMMEHGLQLGVYHNSYIYLDVSNNNSSSKPRRFKGGGGFLKWYPQHAANEFPESIKTCKGLIKSPG